MKTVADMIDDILRREGGYVDHRNDRGGATNFGVTIGTLSDYLGREASKQDVKDMSIDLAREIYLKNYYERPKIQMLPEAVQPFVFDCAINHGPSRAIKFVQHVCNAAGYANQIGVDGKMGPNSANAATVTQEKLGDHFLQELVDERIRFYHRIVNNDESQRVFLAGWLNRAREFQHA